MPSLKLVVFFITLVVLQGCKIIQEVPIGGSIISTSGQHDCGEGQTCIIDVENGSVFSDTFTAVPRGGYLFAGWSKEDRSLCGGSAEPCALLNISEDFTQRDLDLPLVPTFEEVSQNTRLPTHINIQELQYNAGSEGNVYGWTYGDFNGDGFYDIFATNGEWQSETVPKGALSSIFVNDGYGNFTLDESLITDTEGSINPRQVLTADFNGDGIDDIIIADHGYDEEPFPGAPVILYLSSEQSFTRAKNLDDVIGYHHSVAVGDVDNDGDIDAFFTETMKGDGVFFLLNDGKGNMTKNTSLAPPNTIGRGFFTSTLGDIDQDGHIDLVLAGQSWTGAVPTIYWGRSTPGFGTAQKTVLPEPNNSGHEFVTHITIADFNGNGENDIVLNRFGSSRNLYVQLLEGDNRNFIDTTSKALSSYDSDSAGIPWVHVLLAEDVDFDGDLDIVIDDEQTGVRGEEYYFENDGNGQFEPYWQL